MGWRGGGGRGGSEGMRSSRIMMTSFLFFFNRYILSFPVVHVTSDTTDLDLHCHMIGGTNPNTRAGSFMAIPTRGNYHKSRFSLICFVTKPKLSGLV